MITDPFFNTSLCIERLYAEYLKHPKLIIATDYDSSIFDTHEKGYQFPQLINILKECNALGFYVVVFTASKKERHEGILKHCREIGLEISSINENPIKLPYGNEGKIFYNILIDDRAGAGQAYDILRKTINQIYYDLCENYKSNLL